MSLSLDNLKTFYNALIQRIKGFRGNWEQTDPTADDYIKNKPFGVEHKAVTLLPETTVEVEYYNYESLPYTPLEAGETYIVIYNGATYKCTARAWGENCVLIGNGQIYDDSMVNSGEPFCCECFPSARSMFLHTTLGTHTIKIIRNEIIINKLNEEYLPNTIARVKDIPTLEDLLSALETWEGGSY